MNCTLPNQLKEFNSEKLKKEKKGEIECLSLPGAKLVKAKGEIY
jgi:hypothetical protein